MAKPIEQKAISYERFDPNSLWYRTLLVTRRHATTNIGCLNDVVYQLADKNDDLANIEELTDMASRVSSLIEEAFTQGKLVVIEDHTNGKVIGIEPQGKNKAQMIAISRFGEEDKIIKTILDPHIEAGFDDGQFTLGVYGNGFDNIMREIVNISSNGNNNPPSFFIATANEVLFGKIDATKSFSCTRAHRGWQWAVLVRERNNNTSGRRYK